MNHPKILVGCPVHKVKEYCLRDYSDIVKSLTYPNFDILLVDNTNGDYYTNLLKKEKLPVIKGPYFEGAMDRVVSSRNLIKDYVLKNDYEYFFSLEQDVIPQKDIIESLLKHNKKVISAVYYNFKISSKFINHEGIENPDVKPLPMLWVKPDDEKREMMYYVPDEFVFKKPGLYKVYACGLGAVLIHRSVLEHVEFRHDGIGFDDVWFCKDCRDNNIEIFADTSLKCKHITIEGGKWASLKK